MGAGGTSSIIRLLTGPATGATSTVSPKERSKPTHVRTQADKGAKTDEPQIGHRGLQGDFSTVNTSSQSMHSTACLRFMVASVAPSHAKGTSPVEGFCRAATP